jgi:hypothetical protein
MVYYWTTTAWLAVKSDSVEAIIEPTGLTDFSPVSWNEGVKTAVDGGLFISPVMKGWVLLVGGIDAILDEYFKRHIIAPNPLYDAYPSRFFGMCEMSRLFKSVQLFHYDDVYYFYGKASSGKIVRSYLLNGQKNFWGEIGKPNAFEKHHGACFDEGVFEAAVSEDRFDMQDFIPKIAGRWSINPLTFDQPQWHWLENANGLVYNGKSEGKRNTEAWTKEWKKGFAEALFLESNGTKVMKWSDSE